MTGMVSFLDYAERLSATLMGANWVAVEQLAQAMRDCWRDGRRLFICGNGGSSANAIHLANDLHYGIGKGVRPGMKVSALPANVAVLTCLANDEGYDQVFSRQLAVEADAGDLLLVFSGSGNSPNILKALEQAKAMDVRSFAILGYSGGKAKTVADVAIHFAIDDMQIAEDMQMAVGHMIMQWMSKNMQECAA